MLRFRVVLRLIVPGVILTGLSPKLLALPDLWEVGLTLLLVGLACTGLGVFFWWRLGATPVDATEPRATSELNETGSIPGSAE